MKIGVPKETAANERRVALVPDTAARLVKAGLEVAVEQGAGAAAAFPDDAYRGAPAGRGGGGVRRAPGRKGAGGEPGREIPAARDRRTGGGRGRLRQAALRGDPPPRAGVHRAAREGRRCRDHDRGDSRQARADPDHGRRRAGHEAGRGDRRSGGRDGRQLRGDRARTRGAPRRRRGPRTPQPAEHPAAAREPDVREEHCQFPVARDARRQARRGFRRRDHSRDLRHPRRGGAEVMTDYGSMVFVFVLATFIGLGVIRRVSRLLYTPLMSLTNAISAIAVVGSIVVAGADYPTTIRVIGAVALFDSMTNIVSGFLITDRMLKMFKKQ